MAESTNTKAKKVGGDLDALLRNLHLTDDEREGVFLAKEEREGLPKVKWMVVAKLLTVKDFSEASLSSTMRATWNTAREVNVAQSGRICSSSRCFVWVTGSG